MRWAGDIFDVWAFRRRPEGTLFLLLYTSAEKAERHFNGGRFWQIPSGRVGDGETVTDAINRELGSFGLRSKTIWAAEHAYVIYNRRFEEMQAIGVFAAEVEAADVALDPSEHSEARWFALNECLERVHYRGLKEGLRSVDEYVTGAESPARELCLYEAAGRGRAAGGA
jgi:ADP-ribose pyrophosphatase YjhB (NUDIX family)